MVATPDRHEAEIDVTQLEQQTIPTDGRWFLDEMITPAEFENTNHNYQPPQLSTTAQGAEP